MRRAFLTLMLGGALLPAAAHTDENLWKLLRGGGQVVMVRHAVTDPGVGDPPGFRLEECGTQRNLSEAGRREAQRLAAQLRAREVPVATVLSSPWCRCIETARIVFGNDPRVEPALGNLFGRHEREAQQVQALRQLVKRPAGSGNVFMITHGSTTYALTGVSPGTAEMVVLTPQADGSFRVAGRLAVPPS